MMQKDHPEVKFGKTGVLLINLGTPDSTGCGILEKYLKEFLSRQKGNRGEPSNLANNFKRFHSHIQTFKDCSCI